MGRRTACMLACMLALLMALCPLAARAETSAEVREQAADAQVELDELLQQMAEGEERLSSLQAEIDELADESIALQTSIIQNRDRLARIVSEDYKSNAEARIFALLLSSKSIDELISQVYYAQKVSAWQADCIERLNTDKRALEERMDQLDAAKTAQDATLAELSAQSDELDATIAALEEKADRLEQEEREAEERRRAEEEARRAAEEARRAAEEAARKAAEEKARREEEERKRQEALAAAAAAGGVVASPTEGGGGWITCIASAYTIADNDPPGSTSTASGIPLDESVPTVAMPMSMNPSRFYGSRIEISYNGMSVVATVTDCGYMGGGSRGLDLTPAIFRAFGFGSADAWGLREVSYRFL